MERVLSGRPSAGSGQAPSARGSAAAQEQAGPRRPEILSGVEGSRTASRPEPRPGRRRARLFALLPAFALLLGALCLFAAAPAHAQVTVWSATLTADEDGIYFGCDNEETAQDDCSSTSVLSEDEFTYAGTTFAIKSILWDSSGDELFFVVTVDDEEVEAWATKTALHSLTLTVQGSALAVAGASTTDGDFTWSYEPATDWDDGDSISLSLTIPALVKNTGQSPSTQASMGSTSVAQGFTTGAASGGYTLSSIEAVSGVAANATQRDTIRAELWSAGTSGPGSRIAALTVPDSVSAGTVEFAAPAGTTLTASTTYYVVLYTVGDFNWLIGVTNSADEDSGGAAGWSITNTGHWVGDDEPTGSSAWAGWSSPATPIRIVVNGAAAPSSPVWSATLTVDASDDSFGCDDGDMDQGDCSGTDGALSNAQFTYAGTTFTINGFFWDSTEDELFFEVLVAGEEPEAVSFKTAFRPLTLTVQGSALAFADASTDNGVYWSYEPEPDWTDGLAVALSLALPQTTTTQPTPTQPTSGVLVSNIEQTAGVQEVATGSVVNAQGFTTGSASGGYALASIEIVVGEGANATQRGTIRAELWSAATGGGPGSRITTLTVPTTFSAGTVEFAAPAGTTLTSNRKYFFVLYTTGSFDMEPSTTTTSDEDSGGLPGWSIDDASQYDESRGVPDQNIMWSEDSDYIFRIRVNGSAATTTTSSSGATLSGLTASSATSAGGTYSALGLTPATLPPSVFKPTTTTYTASVANDVTHVKLTPTVTDTNATVQVGKGASLTTVASGSSSAAIALDEGRNEITVRVTAQDSTTKDYTVRVTRAASLPAGTVWSALLTPVEFATDPVTFGCDRSGGFTRLRCSALLDDNRFSYGGNNYQVFDVLLTAGGELRLRLNPNSPSGLSGLSLCAGDTALAFSAAAIDGNANTATWSSTGLTWTHGTPVRLSIGTSCGQTMTTPQPTAGVLVKNTGQSGDSLGALGSISLAQAFTTGSASGGYTLTSIGWIWQGNASATNAANVRGELWSAGSGGPGSKIADLTVPTTFSAGTVEFAAPAGTTLTANTTYYAVLYTIGTFSPGISRTNSNDEDSGGATGWSIADTSHFASADSPTTSTTWTASTSAASLRIVVKGATGTTTTQSSVATLSGLAASSATSASGPFTALTLTPPVSPDRLATVTSYAARVPQATTHVKLTPTVSDTNASVKVGKQGSTLTTVSSGTASGAIALVDGPNAITVRVTAENGSTMIDYTVIVTRGQAAVLSTDATLRALTASSSTSAGGAYGALGLTPSAFSAATTSYTATVANSVTHVKLTPTVNETNATVQVGKGGEPGDGEQRLGERRHRAGRGRQRHHGARHRPGHQRDAGLHRHRHAVGDDADRHPLGRAAARRRGLERAGDGDAVRGAVEQRDDTADD